MRERFWRGVLYGAIAVAVVAGGLQAIHDERLGRPLVPGSPTPAFAAPVRGGGSFELSSARGEVVMLSFWATWCGPCRRELPVLRRLEAEYAPRGVRLVAANVDAPEDREELVDAFLRRAGGEPPLVVWPDGATVEAWRARRLPTLYILDAQGEIVASHSSLQDESVLRRELETALARGVAATAGV
jgi:thiol-disulfide isomerase/thioredoxin